MHRSDDAFAAAQRRRFTRENAHLHVRHDARLFMQPAAYRLWKQEREAKAAEHEPESVGTDELKAMLQLKAEVAALRAEITFRKLIAALKAYNPSQPRVPAGNSDGGQWTNDLGAGRNDSRILSDASPEVPPRPGDVYAQLRPRSGPILINGRWVQPTPSQAARLAAAEAQSRDAIQRVRELDPNWRPQPSTYESVEGLIRAHRAEAREAEARLRELANAGIGPGEFAKEWIPARGPNRSFNKYERDAGLRIFRLWGCHTCGSFQAGTPSGFPVLDHQYPTALISPGTAQRLYPQCLSCSLRQGGSVQQLKRSPVICSAPPKSRRRIR
ncbi:MAG: hypothetical protein FJX62_13285 [Alphaproteobacteria bacterium]|nr:hypothetical protein [Alphaproteobacteria bacterium]